jgi:hypothetical protein
MDPLLSKLAAKKLLSEYTFLQSDDQLKRELIELNKKEFLDRVSKKRPDIKETDPEQKPQGEKEKDPVVEVTNESTRGKLKRLYREIVKITHPDKTKDERLIELYMKATEAHIMNNLFEIYFICDELRIKVEFDDDDFSLFVELIDKKKKEISSLEGSFIWIYINAPNEEEKEKIVDIYINRYF